jgi:hypothetical protein
MLTLVGNWMEIMKEMLPGLKRIAATGNAQPRGRRRSATPRRPWQVRLG